MIRGILAALLSIFIIVHAQAADALSTCNIRPNPGENAQNKAQIAAQMIGLGFQGTPSEAQVRCILNTPREGRRAKLQQMIAEQKATPVTPDPGRIGTAVATNTPTPPSGTKILGTFQKGAAFTVKNAPNSGNTFVPETPNLSGIVWDSTLPGCANVPKGIKIQLNVNPDQQKSYIVTCNDPNGCQAILADPFDCQSQLTGNYSVTSNVAPPPTPPTPPAPLPPLPIIGKGVHQMIVSQNDEDTLLAPHGRGSANSDLPKFIKLKYSRFSNINGEELKDFLTTTTARLEIGLKCLNPQGCQLLCNNSNQNTGACGSAFDLDDKDYELLPPDNLNIIGELTSTNGVTVSVESDNLRLNATDGTREFRRSDMSRGQNISDVSTQLNNFFQRNQVGSQKFALKLNCQDPAIEVCRVRYLNVDPSTKKHNYMITGGAMTITPLQ